MSGNNILIMGASGGIGSALTELFPHDKLFLHYHKNKPQHDGIYKSVDICDCSGVEKMVNSILEQHNRIDVVIVATGINLDGFTHKFKPENWNAVIKTNLIGAYNIIRAVLPSMRANKFGRIILLSSVVFQKPVLGTSAYSASKAGLVGLTRTVAYENATLGVTCNCLSLGYFEAGMLYLLPTEIRDEIQKSIPMKRFGHVEEVKNAIQFLIDTEYITGQTISINGGLYME